MSFDLDVHPVRTCVVTRGFVYDYYDILPANDKIKNTALLLHGHGDFSFGWRSTIPGLLARNIRCIVPDMLGFGSSSKPVDVKSYKLKAMADDMSEILKDAGITDKIIVIGHDWGSQLASRLTLHHPSLIAACVSITGTYIPPFPQPLSLDAFTTMLPNFSYWHFFTSEACPELLRTRMEVFWNVVIRKSGEPSIPMSEMEPRVLTSAASTPRDWERRPTLWDEQTYNRYLATYRRGGWEGPMNWYKAFFWNFDDEKQFLSNPRIDVPFLTILGLDDPAVPVEVAEQSKPLLPNGTLATMPCGHWISQEDGPGLAKLVCEWLDEILQPPAI